MFLPGGLASLLDRLRSGRQETASPVPVSKVESMQKAQAR
jgi:hypothetical protein